VTTMRVESSEPAMTAPGRGIHRERGVGTGGCAPRSAPLSDERSRSRLEVYGAVTKIIGRGIPPHRASSDVVLGTEEARIESSRCARVAPVAHSREPTQGPRGDTHVRARDRFAPARSDRAERASKRPREGSSRGPATFVASSLFFAMPPRRRKRLGAVPIRRTDRQNRAEPILRALRARCRLT